MLTRRQFIKKCAFTMLATASLSLTARNDVLAIAADTIPVLLYHRVGPEPDSLTISAERFRQDMQHLYENGYQTVGLDQVRDFLQSPKVLPENAILITFDDGYLNNYQNAFPILQEYSMTASFFIITGMVGQENRMTVAQIREMAQAGMAMGSHTVSHRRLGDLALDEAGNELVRSKSDLEEMLGRSVDFIAYPCGSYNQGVMDIAQSAGYFGGFTTNSGFASVHGNRLSMNRIPVFHYDRSLTYVMLRKGWIPSVLA